jgi:hypothetical protein
MLVLLATWKAEIGKIMVLYLSEKKSGCGGVYLSF